MVGGFSQSEYLRERVLRAVADRNIEVWKPPYGYVCWNGILRHDLNWHRWSAVARGALMKGLAEVNPKFADVSVTGRVARYHYATESAKPYETRRHPTEYK